MNNFHPISLDDITLTSNSQTAVEFAEGNEFDVKFPVHGSTAESLNIERQSSMESLENPAEVAAHMHHIHHFGLC